ncbi:MAG: hypothetical protein Nk1A_8070 [Endomicrobiia bacterium]|nr:MAG: hypothetical protein Nk1A_8070 [Endomicrobiia bacterium]
MWETLGGEFSVSKQTDGKLHWSEASVEKVAHVASEITIRRSLKDTDIDIGYETAAQGNKEVIARLLKEFPENTDDVTFQSQSFYLQPMKHSDIHYIAPESAIKNGIANINTVEAYSNPGAKLSSWKVPTLHLLVQLNSEHEVDDSEVSEMSQVITALAQLGTGHAVATAAYKAIGQSVANNISAEAIVLESESEEVNE